MRVKANQINTLNFLFFFSAEKGELNFDASKAKGFNGIKDRNKKTNFNRGK